MKGKCCPLVQDSLFHFPKEFDESADGTFRTSLKQGGMRQKMKHRLFKIPVGPTEANRSVARLPVELLGDAVTSQAANTRSKDPAGKCRTFGLSALEEV